ncbi:hypothetical protein AB4391_24135, partial [Vibrio lentus]
NYATKPKGDINKLKRLEVKYRRSEKISAANNAALTLSELEIDFNNKIKWLDRVISGERDEYNKYRAITDKGILFLRESKDIELTLSEILLLQSAYAYGFNQKSDSIFNRAHEILWNYSSKLNDIHTKTLLFKHSSLYWRISGDESREMKYSSLLSESVFSGSKSILDKMKHYYVIIRMKQITPNYG